MSLFVLVLVLLLSAAAFLLGELLREETADPKKGWSASPQEGPELQMGYDTELLRNWVPPWKRHHH